MMNAKLLRNFFSRASVAGAGSILCLAGVMACSGGDTDGGRSSDDQGPGDPFISDGGSGATLDIKLVDSELAVGETTGFFVRLKDPQGNPIPFIRIFCESERGIAIIEPSAGGVAFESTGSDGSMSGRIGGVTPGSFLMECRAQQGFNLYDRVSVKITGEVPAGFQGFPGAAGGNLGGGVIIDQTPNVDDGVGLRVSSVRFTDAGGADSVGPLDYSINPDCDGNPATDDVEPFTYTKYAVTVTNGTKESVFVNTIQFTIRDSGAAAQTARQTQTVEIAAGASTVINGILTTHPSTCGAPALTAGCYVGSSSAVELGSANGTVVLTGTSVNDTPFSIQGNFSIQWDLVNNC